MQLPLNGNPLYSNSSGHVAVQQPPRAGPLAAPFVFGGPQTSLAPTSSSFRQPVLQFIDMYVIVFVSLRLLMVPPFAGSSAVCKFSLCSWKTACFGCSWSELSRTTRRHCLIRSGRRGKA